MAPTGGRALRRYNCRLSCSSSMAAPIRAADFGRRAAFGLNALYTAARLKLLWRQRATAMACRVWPGCVCLCTALSCVASLGWRIAFGLNSLHAAARLKLLWRRRATAMACRVWPGCVCLCTALSCVAGFGRRVTFGLNALYTAACLKLLWRQRATAMACRVWPGCFVFAQRCPASQALGGASRSA